MTQSSSRYSFGAIEEVDVGKRCSTLYELKKEGIHTTSQNRHWIKRGMISLIVSGKDVDNGDRITLFIDVLPNNKRDKYVEDGSLSRPAIVDAVMKNFREHIPIRVIRSWLLHNQYAPLTGYRYDGIYDVNSVIRESLATEKPTQLFRWLVELARRSNQKPVWDPIPVPKYFKSKITVEVIFESPTQDEETSENCLTDFIL